MRGNLSFCANGRQVVSNKSDCKDGSNCLQNVNIQNCSSGEKFSLFYALNILSSDYEKPSNEKHIHDRAIIEAIGEFHRCFQKVVSIFSDFDLSISFFKKSRVKTKTVTSTLTQPCGLLVPACSAHAQVASYNVQGKYRSLSFWKINRFALLPSLNRAISRNAIWQNIWRKRQEFVMVSFWKPP